MVIKWSPTVSHIRDSALKAVERDDFGLEAGLMCLARFDSQQYSVFQNWNLT